jgi:hypothetical protein
MPLPEQFANEAATTLNGAILAGATSLVVTSATGFPAAPFRIRVSGTLTASGTGTEYMTVTAVSGTTWTVTRAVETPFNTALGFATAAVVEQVVTTVGLFEALAFVNVKSPRFGAKGDDATDDTVAIQAALNYAATLGDPDTPGATVYFPPGTYRWGSPAAVTTPLSVGSRTRLLGAGRGATTLRRMADTSIQFYGSAPADTGPRNIYSAVEHLHFEGGDFNSSLLDLVYVSQFQLDHVRAFGCGGSFLECVEVWDSSFSNLFTDWCGSATRPAIWIRNSRAATPTFGWSTDSSNQLKFLNLHCETFTGAAIRIEPGVSNAAPPNGLYFNVVKCETAQVVSGTSFIYIDQACQTVHFDKIYCSLNAFAAGNTVATDVITNNCAGQCSLLNIEIASNAVSAMVRSGIRNNTTGANAYTTIDGVVGIFGQAPTVGLIEVASAGGLEVDHINTNNGTLITGFQMEVQERMLSLAADITTTSTTIVDMTNMSFSNVLPGTYTLRFDGVYRSSITTGYARIGFGGTATTAAPIIGRVTNNTSTTAGTTGVVTAVNTGHTGGNASVVTTDYGINGFFTFTVSATGTIVLRWFASAAGTMTMRGGTWAILSRNR